MQLQGGTLLRKDPDGDYTDTIFIIISVKQQNMHLYLLFTQISCKLLKAIRC